VKDDAMQRADPYVSMLSGSDFRAAPRWIFGAARAVVSARA
jgi:hypothetical protein